MKHFSFYAFTLNVIHGDKLGEKTNHKNNITAVQNYFFERRFFSPLILGKLVQIMSPNC